MTTTTEPQPAGWYADPSGTHQQRWWDGTRWTDDVADAGQAGVDHLPPAPPAPVTAPLPPRRGGGGRTALRVVLAVVAVVVAAVAIAVLALGGEDDPLVDDGTSGGGLAGSYLVEGTNPNGSAYRGTAEIAEAGDVYLVTWVTGGTTSTGEGRLRGDTFRVTYTGTLTGTGSATYELQDDGTLVGTWGTGANQGTETLIPD